MFQRLLSKAQLDADSCFLWGPRQSGKSTLLRQLFPKALYYDLLLSREFRRLSANPGLLAEECAALRWNGDHQPQPIIVDEIQKLPGTLMADLVKKIIEHPYLAEAEDNSYYN